MDKVYISINKHSRLFSTIDISSKNEEWASLHIDNLVPFSIEETKRPCTAYPQGVFPGGIEKEDKQVIKVYNFTNMIEFSKIVADEVETVEGKSYLTTKYYDRRKEGWSSKADKKKYGKVVGYCIDGNVFSPISDTGMREIFTRMILYPMLRKRPAFEKLVTQLRDGVGIVLIGAPEKYLKQLGEALLTT